MKLASSTRDFLTIKYFALLLLTFNTLSSLGQSINWIDNIGGPGNTEWANDVITKNDSIIIIGVSDSPSGDFNTNLQDIGIKVIDSQGQTLITKEIGGAANDGGKSIVATSDGGYMLTGISFSSDGDATGSVHQGSGDFWVIKLDSQFNIAWQKMYGGTNRDEPQSIIETGDGNFVIAGYSASTDGDVVGLHVGSPLWNDAWVIKIDPSGNLIWQKCIGGTADDAAWGITETEGGYVFTGHSQSADGDLSGNNGNRDIIVCSLNKANGSIVWLKRFGGSEMDTALDILYTERNSLLVTGHANSNDGDFTNINGSSEFLFLDLDTNGNVISNRTYGSPGGDVSHTVIELNKNRYVLSGRAGTGGGSGGDVSTIYGSSTGTDAWMIVLDSLGTLLNEKNYGGSSSDQFYGAVKYGNSDVIAVGKTASNDFDLSQNNGGSDWLVINVELDAFISSATLSEISSNVDVQLYPNPAINQFSIFLDPSTNDPDYIIEMYDFSGKMVQQLHTGLNTVEVAPGAYTVIFRLNESLTPVSAQKLIITP